MHSERRPPAAEVRKLSDRTFLIHLGGKIEVTPRVSLRDRDDLSRACTPGVARVCMAIHDNPEDARRLTIKRNTVAVLTDGTAVAGALLPLGEEASPLRLTAPLRSRTLFIRRNLVFAVR